MVSSSLWSLVVHQLGKWIGSAGVWLALSLIAVYRLVISPLLGPRCRFYPSCSEYGAQAFKRFGLVKGLWLTICRLARCSLSMLAALIQCLNVRLSQRLPSVRRTAPVR